MIIIYNVNKLYTWENRGTDGYLSVATYDQLPIIQCGQWSRGFIMLQ